MNVFGTDVFLYFLKEPAMSLSRRAASILIDLVENKLAMFQIEDREDLREVLTLQRCLDELKDILLSAKESREEDFLPHRGRHRKLSALVREMDTRALPPQRQRA